MVFAHVEFAQKTDGGCSLEVVAGKRHVVDVCMGLRVKIILGYLELHALRYMLVEVRHTDNTWVTIGNHW